MGIIERKQREKENRRSEILNAARRVFGEKGYKNAAITDIAMEAQLSPGTLYLYFKNKEELYTTLSVDMLEDMTEEIKNVTAESSLSIEEKLFRVNEIFLETYETDSKVLINIFHLQSGEALNRLSPEVIQKIKDISSNSHKALASIIQEGMDQGIFRTEHPVAIADIIWGNFSGIVLWVESKYRLNQRKNFVKMTLETGFDIFLEGLKHG